MSRPAPEEKRRLALAERVSRNPYEYLAVHDVGCLFAFGDRSMTALLKLGAPMVAKKINPCSFKAWLDSHQNEIGKLTES